MITANEPGHLPPALCRSDKILLYRTLADQVDRSVQHTIDDQLGEEYGLCRSIAPDWSDEGIRSRFHTSNSTAGPTSLHRRQIKNDSGVVTVKPRPNDNGRIDRQETWNRL